MHRLLTSLILVVLELFGASAHASLLVDTGTPVVWPDAQGDPVLSGAQWLAARFEISAPSTITSAKGYLSSANDGGVIHVALYSGDGNYTPLFADDVNVPAVTFDSTGRLPVLDWYGADAVNWILDAGTYWLAFEVHPGSSFEGFMATPSANALGCDGYSTIGPPDTCSSLALAIRIEGTSGVPAPPTFALALAGLVLVARFRPYRSNSRM